MKNASLEMENRNDGKANEKKNAQWKMWIECKVQSSEFKWQMVVSGRHWLRYANVLDVDLLSTTRADA